MKALTEISVRLQRTFLPFALLTCAAATVAGAGTPALLADWHDFTNATSAPGKTAGWTTWSPRPEIAPHFAVNATAGRSPGGALEIRTAAASDFGAWQTPVTGLAGGCTYKFTAWYRVRNVPHERRSVIARLEWQDAQGAAVRPPEYALDVARSGNWTRVEYTTQVPAETRQVQIQLSLGFAPNATIWWDDIQLREEPSPPNRIVRAMTVFHRPRGTKSSAASVEQFCQLVAQSAAAKPDLICLPEGITVIGTGKSYSEVSEPIPGPTTRRLGALARKMHSYLVAGIYERADALVYNTAVLINRQGAVTGTYRKTHLPREEWEKGITPGNRYPVFDTELGKVGLLICWDLQFPEPARAMALKGAEILVLPIWGGRDILARARAIENSVFLISSTYDMRSFIVDPTGAILAEATRDQPVATAELRLDQKLYQPWLGNMKTRTWKERRPDLSLE